MVTTNKIKKELHKDIDKVKEKESKKQSKWRMIVENTTVEPMLGGYIISSVLTNLATQNLYLEKACRVNLNFGAHICDALSRRETANYTVEETMIQELVAGMSIWKTFLQSIIPAVLIIFLGSWSDRNCRRKPCMLAPILGDMLSCIGLIVTAYYSWLPMEVSGFIEAIFPAMMGGWFTMFMAVFSYIGNIASVEKRTLRIGVVNIFCSVGVPIGTALSGIILKKTGFYGVYSFSLVLYTFSILYGIFFISELPPNSPAAIMANNNNNDVAGAEKLPDKKVSFLKDFFDVKYIKEVFEVVFKHGEFNRKKRVILIMVVMIVVFGPIQGEMSVIYLFTRYKFNWDEVDFSLFSTYSMVTNLLGTMFSVGVFSHLLQIDDALIGVISCMSKILAGFVYAFAATPFVFYLGAIVDIVNGTSFIAMRSIISKMVPPDELGKINSLFGVCEALDPLIYGPMYSAVYRATINTLPGTFFLIGGALTAPAAFIFLWMYKEHRNEAKARRALDELESRSRDNQCDINGAAVVIENEHVTNNNNNNCHKSKDNLVDETSTEINHQGVDNEAFEK
uniref:Proton-coupled folate transporter n=1 Tax=Cacopsylla melanoneura TaxID=428564 RepID=A0A8D8WW50_9HEMI